MSKLALVDVSVIIYQTYFRNNRYFNPKAIRPEQAIAYMTREFEKLIAPAIAPGFIPILLFDKKTSDNKYWRQDFIEQNQEEHDAAWETQGSIADQVYKGNRLKTKDYTALLDYIKEAAERLKAKYRYLVYPGLEADDLAALVCKYKKPTDLIDLVTVDRDWSGLVDDIYGIRWINMLPKKRYTIETEEQVIEYFANKLDPRINHPSECFALKREYAEVSDNLPKNCRIELIDLINHAAPIEMGYEPAHKLVKDFLRN